MTVLKRARDTARIGLLAAVEHTVPRWPASWIAARQQRRLRSIMRHAYATVPFYRQALDERGLIPADFRTVADLERLPLIDGAMLRRDPAQFASTAYDDRTRELRYSSGSTSGVQRPVYWDTTALLNRLAHEERDRPIRNALTGRRWGQRQLYLLPEGSYSLVQRQLWDTRLVVPPWLAHRRVIAAHRPFDELVDAINDFQPHVIFSYGSFADIFIRLLLDRRQSIVAPRVWMYGGDLLPAGGRRLLEQTLGCHVHSTYQAIETGRLGFQCERGAGFHLNVDLCAVRLIDDAGRPVAPGETGEIVISNLHNRAMVLLNYRLEDRRVLDPAPCPCGRSLPVLARLEGRSSDVIYGPDGQPLSAFVLEGNMFTGMSAIATQIVSQGPGRIEYRVVPVAGVDRDALRAEIIAEIQAVLGPAMAVDVRFVDALPPSPHGKQRKVQVERAPAVPARPS